MILWGAYVRASGAGAGCGGHWPLCNGAVVPPGASVSTLIEYSHRLSSGLVLILVVALAVWAFRATPGGHLVRRGAVFAVVFTLTEAALGAGLVLFQLVARDQSLARAVAISAHLLNTLLLLASLALTWRWAGRPADPEADGEGAGLALSGPPPEPRLAWAFAAAGAGVMLLGATGAVAALGDTLFPSRSLAQGLAEDFSSASHLLLRLRLVHPFLAMAVGLFLLYLCQRAREQPEARRWAHRLRFLVLAQWAAGFVTLGLLAPVVLQLAHLLLADLVWIALVLLAADALARAPAAARQRLVPAPA